MTTPIHFEPELSRQLADLYDTGTPDYRDDLFRATARTRQRPAWSFPERWLPMAEYASRATMAPRLPWRTIAVALLVLALAVAAAALYIGSQTTRLPAPFGPARNGLIAYSAAGDIFAADPTTGIVTAIITGPASDRRPVFSPDGTRLAFLRERPTALGRFDLVVAAKDGSGQKVLTSDAITTDHVVEWAPDGTYLLVNGGDDAALTRYDVDGSAAPSVIARDVHIFPGGTFRPPDGKQILYEHDTVDSTALFVMDADGSHPKLLLQRPAADREGSITANVRWSPDGRMIAFGLIMPATTAHARIHVMNADGTGLHMVGQETRTPAPGIRVTGDGSGLWVENDLAWSPDSRFVAFNRWEQDASDGAWSIRPIGIAPAAGGKVQDLGPAPVSDGAIFDFSPDGKQLVSVSGKLIGAPTDGTGERPMLIDAQTGQATQAAWDVASGTSWQRLAP